MPRQRSDLWGRAGLAVIGTYAVLGGATGIGLLTPTYRLTTLIFLSLLAAIWLVIRWRQHWTCFRTPLDLLILVWIIAIVLSFLSNLEVQPKMFIGIFFATVYVGLWLILQDSLRIKRLGRKFWSKASF